MNDKFKVRLSWAFYDWANSAWSAIIITFIFSRYFVDVLSPNPDQGTLFWTWTIGLSSLLAAILSPIVGSISDQSQKSKIWLVFTTLIYALIALSLWFAEPNLINLFIIIILIFIGNLSYEISQIFYNGQLKLITNKKNFAKIKPNSEKKNEEKKVFFLKDNSPLIKISNKTTNHPPLVSTILTLKLLFSNSICIFSLLHLCISKGLG